MFKNRLSRPRRLFFLPVGYYEEDDGAVPGQTGSVNHVSDAPPERDIVAELHGVVAEVTGRPAATKRRIGFV